MNNLKIKGISEEELRKTKAQIKGNLFLGLESVSSIMSRLGKTELSFNRVKTAEETVEELEKVSLADINRVMERLWLEDRISILTLGQKEFSTDFDKLIKASL